MDTSRWSTRKAGMVLAVALVGCMAVAPVAHGAKKATKTYTKGAGGSLGGVPVVIPDGGGTATQVVRSAYPGEGPEPAGQDR